MQDFENFSRKRDLASEQKQLAIESRTKYRRSNNPIAIRAPNQPPTASIGATNRFYRCHPPDG